MKSEEELTEVELLARLEQFLNTCQSQDSASKMFGVSRSYLNAILHKHIALGVKIPRQLGYQRIVKYRRIACPLPK